MANYTDYQKSTGCDHWGRVILTWNQRQMDKMNVRYGPCWTAWLTDEADRRFAYENLGAAFYWILFAWREHIRDDECDLHCIKEFDTYTTRVCEYGGFKDNDEVLNRIFTDRARGFKPHRPYAIGGVDNRTQREYIEDCEDESENEGEVVYN
jgi:hypothetical protein